MSVEVSDSAFDSDKLIGEVLANLLSNALRHTPTDGSVVIAAEPAPDGVSFSVTDTGTGIPADALPHVFDRFVKAKDSGGAGLGLAIVKAFVESHGGTIAAESERERGGDARRPLSTRPYAPGAAHR